MREIGQAIVLAVAALLLCSIQNAFAFMEPHMHRAHDSRIPPTFPFSVGFASSSGALQMFSGDSNPEDEARKLREQAELLRREVEDVEREKQEAARVEREKEDQIEAQKRDVRMRYSAEVPILKGDGTTVMERVDFPPRIAGGKSRIKACQASLPLGIILGESEDLPGMICVDEVTPGSNGEVAGVRKGDVLRACTACQVTMETPTWQLLAGGIGQPKTKRFMFSVDGRPFEEVMDAVASNRMDPEERDCWLVLEHLG